MHRVADLMVGFVLVVYPHQDHPERLIHFKWCAEISGFHVCDDYIWGDEVGLL